MINLNKKQVNALLKFIGKDSTRPILEHLCITEHEQKFYAVATDGYIAVALELHPDDATLHEGRLIRRSAIEKWHKLATGKSRLTTEELIKVSEQDFADNGEYASGNYPDVFSVIPNKGTAEAVESIGVNADYYKHAQDLADKPLRYEFHGKMGAITARDDGNIYVIMPIK